jgi:hypothetical protein
MLCFTMRTTLLTSTALGLTLFTLAGSADAYPDYGAAIPNGVNQCRYCHTQADGGPRTAFGTAFQSAGDQWAAALATKDSDGDGQTNAEELGDPCGTFLEKMEPGRTSDISDPADKNSKAASPKTPSCMGAGSASGGASSSSSSGGGGSGPIVAPPEKSTAAGPGSSVPSPGTGVANACASIAPGSSGGALGAVWLAIGALALRRRFRR